ncbi:MAG: Tat pathway signal protein [Acidobacteriia bacterium]|nr:Tat pathway signal protein [Terriglobia bacterium]
MDRRRFLQRVAVTTAVGQALRPVKAAEPPAPAPPADIDITGQTFLCEFKLNAVNWKAYEDLSKRDGSITFVPERGTARVMGKRTEATFTQAEVPHLGLKMEDISASGPDLLANKLLEHGDPDPIQVRDAAPPLGSPPPQAANAAGPPQGGFAAGAGGVRSWNTFVGTRECYDTMPVYAGGNTRTYHPNQYFPELTGAVMQKRWEGLLGGWMPAVHKVFPLSDTAYIEAIVFGDVEARDKFIVQTWHRTARIENGKVTKVVYGYSYPAFPPTRQDPKPEEFYRALLVFANYWDKQLSDVVLAELPDKVWVDMMRYAVAKEIMVRPGGVYPKYGAVDRDYYGSEYDGFQDIFTASVYTNLELGRFEPCKAILDNYLTDFTDAKGMINMRGPETAQFGLTLSLIARYLNYTHDTALIQKHRGKIEATAAMLLAMHDESLKLPEDAPGHGLIHGWSESDACLAPRPETWWQPYYANSAFAARGLKDLSRAWSGMNPKLAQDWLKRANTLQETTIKSMEKWTLADRNPPYVPLLPGSRLTFKEAMRLERPSPQQWPHRPYAELVMADVLPHPLANQVVETMGNYGATTIGVLANVGGSRAVLGFIAYGYAAMLLRLDRIEEYLLFLYSHRFHDHTPGSWTAGEVAGINGGTATFCIPAQQTIPIVVRWMLVLEDSDEDRLYFGKGLPREWVASGQTIKIDQAPTRWGRVHFTLTAKPASKSVIATVELPRTASPKELHVKLRMPLASAVKSATVNGRPAALGGVHNDTVIFQPGTERRFEVVGQCG